jgi:flavin-dependent dehydrogenase
MNVPTFSKLAVNSISASTKLQDNSRVAVLGGGPAGSFFSYFLLDMAERVGLDLKVDIYEPRDFSLPAPKGCNMCAGVISETLIQNLATEGINLPATIIQNAISSYVLHMGSGLQRIDAPLLEKRIGTVYRGSGPLGAGKFEFQSFDNHLLSLAEKKGAGIIHQRVTGVERDADRLRVVTRAGVSEGYDLLGIATGVNTAAIRFLEDGYLKYKPPKTTKTALVEYLLGKETIKKYFGDSLHVFLLDIPRLDFAMLIPKGDYLTACLLGKDVDERLLQEFLSSAEVKSCFPPGWSWDQSICHCFPRINVHAAEWPYADRIVFIGDCGTTRLYKDGIGAAYRAAKSAAATAMLQGISAEDFKRYYGTLGKSIELDNRFGRIIFLFAHIIQKLHFSHKAVLTMVAEEQSKPGTPPLMSSILWDTFTGSSPYQDVFWRSLQLGFIGRFIFDLAGSLVSG